MVEFRLEDHEAGPMPRLIKERKVRGLAPPSKADGTWSWVPAKEETDWSHKSPNLRGPPLTLVPEYSTYFVSLDIYFLALQASLCGRSEA